ncbi:hypothetical protein CJI55_05560 [Gardnerella vaginalis]|nr:hypothetical protein CG397_02030 [Gardnerella vaginalis]RIY22849.1 hypothetical protein CJI55_05560 [Gardnerella vaginalis]
MLPPCFSDQCNFTPTNQLFTILTKNKDVRQLNHYQYKTKNTAAQNKKLQKSYLQRYSVKKYSNQNLWWGLLV